ncbi:uncharacterized protein EI97DRAFT_491621, partial [Westerdykella ornata]
MIVRESPKSGGKNPPANWPPKNPHEALLSSPSGRRKYEQRRERNSVSPSPVKRRPQSRALLDAHMGEEEEEEEDEETLQLKLAQIEARLKLKKLQKAREAKEQAAQGGDGDGDGARTASRASNALGSRRPEASRPPSAVEVPMSPVRNRREPEEHTSPRRVLLGIDKGLRAQDVSLKRASSSKVASTGVRGEREIPKIKSFSQRLAESRNQDRAREEKRAKIEKSRSRGFGLKDLESERTPSRAASSLSAREASPFKRELSGTTAKGPQQQDGQVPRPLSSHSLRPELSRETSAASTTPSRPESRSATASKYAEMAQRDNSTEAPSFDSFSRLHLKTRNMEHSKLTRVLDGKTVFTIPQLLKTVRAPEYDPPDMENDYVVFGVISSKSSPLTPKNARSNQSVGNQDVDANQSGKFMVIRLTDLKWELDVFLFDTGFSQFWKLPLGTVVAILNPDIMPPRNRDTGKFSLKLTSSDDTVLEVGTARDLDFCHARRKDGKDCGQWIDGRKTEYCDFHIELQLEKSKRGRMEVNTMSGTGFGKPGGGRSGMFGGAGRGGAFKGDQLKREGRFHDAFLHDTMYITPGVGTAARLLDSDEQGFERGASRAERHRKQLAEREKERELAKKLGETGKGAGAEYLRAKGAGDQPLPARPDGSSQSEQGTKGNSNLAIDALGLLGRKAEDVSLAPVKRKRPTSSKSITSNEPVGWSGAFKRGLLLSPTKGEASTRNGREASPVKKRARLLLPEKGIREPGRD